jgi:hypothetical protein
LILGDDQKSTYSSEVRNLFLTNYGKLQNSTYAVCSKEKGTLAIQLNQVRVMKINLSFGIQFKHVPKIQLDYFHKAT